MELTKIVITGGPCAGKSTAMSRIQEEFTELGYTVLFVSETATELINGGVAPWTCKTSEEFQKLLMNLQIEKERIFELSANVMSSEKVLIVCDRGMLDNKAYMSQEAFVNTLKELNLNEIEIRDNYDAVFHLVTAADGAEEFYTTENNSARTETPEQAIMLDRKLLSSWTGHPHLRVIDNSSAFENKIKKLIVEISSFLGEPEPLEIERKFLIEYPDIDWLENLPNCKKIEIIQTYLKSGENEEVRVRQRGMNGNYIYFKTIKRKVDDLKRIEIEKRLSKDEYLTLLMEADTEKRQIRKNRYCLMDNNQYFEIDVYPFWNDKAILEIELSDENTGIVFPERIRIIKEVTDDENFKNASLAKIK
ncbi:MAG: AAA family ATPase [Clostridia bacterium]|nr:AAA family ATPase [Clostridia bacterium]